MKIALSHYSAKRDISGVSTWFEKFVLNLHKKGIEISVHLQHLGSTLEESSILPVFHKAGIEVYSVLRSNSLYSDVTQTLNFLNRSQPTVYLPQCLDSHFLAASIAGRQGLPWVLTMHSDDPAYWNIIEARPPISWGGQTVCVSDYISSEVKNRRIDGSPHTIPYGVEIPAYKANFSKNPFHVVYSGRLVETQKRLSLVVRSLISACEISPIISASIIGDGPAYVETKNAIIQAGLINRINFEGRLSPDEVRGKLARAQAILLMSDFEGLPVSLLEAMAAGVVPVVRNIQSGIPELIKHEKTGLLVNGDPATAGLAICRLAENPLLWEKCSKGARQLVSDLYNDDISNDRWIDLILKLNQATSVQYPILLPDDFC